MSQTSTVLVTSSLCCSRWAKVADVHYILGVCLRKKEQLDEAIAEFRQVIALDPASLKAHFDLGNALYEKGQLDEAIAEYRQVLALNPHDRDALHNLGVALDAKLTAVLSGQQSPADAFAAEPELADYLQQRQRRYNAAFHAAQAAAGQGEDAGSLSYEVTRLLHNWALGWLRVDLKAYAQLVAEQDNPYVKRMIQQQLANWHRDPNLAPVRDPQALDRLPDDERAAWQALWRDVDELAKQLAKK
jgi:tetratricopeptide (TPR) repeat protein